jgi:fimbrial chaperone protein
MFVLSLNLRSLLLPFFLGLSFLTTSPSLAAIFFSLSPMVTQFTPVGRGASQAFQVVNGSGDEPVAVEMYVVTRAHDLDGTEINSREKAEEDFLVYPPQMIVQPGQAQTVRVSWLGEAEPDKELAFRLIAEQIPGVTDTETTRSQGREVTLTTLVRYAASVYITPDNVASDVSVESATHQKNAKGEDELVLMLQNQGTAHEVIADVTYTFTPKAQADKAITIPLDIPVVNLLAGDRRRFVVPWPKELPVGDINATINLGQ